MVVEDDTVLEVAGSTAAEHKAVGGNPAEGVGQGNPVGVEPGRRERMADSSFPVVVVVVEVDTEGEEQRLEVAAAGCSCWEVEVEQEAVEAAEAVEAVAAAAELAGLTMEYDVTHGGWASIRTETYQAVDTEARGQKLLEVG